MVQGKGRRHVFHVIMRMVGEGKANRRIKTEHQIKLLVSGNNVATIVHLLVKRTTYSNLVVLDHVMTNQLPSAKDE